MLKKYLHFFYIKVFQMISEFGNDLVNNFNLLNRVKNYK